MVGTWDSLSDQELCIIRCRFSHRPTPTHVQIHTNYKKFARNFSIGFFLNRNVFKFYLFLVSTGKIYDTGLRNK